MKIMFLKLWKILVQIFFFLLNFKIKSHSSKDEIKIKLEMFLYLKKTWASVGTGAPYMEYKYKIY